MTAVPSLLRLEAFLGGWEIDRSITDRHGRAACGHFTGRAVFRRAVMGLDYRETGQLVLGGGPVLAASRAYGWREAGETIEVRFEDGRLFHRFRPGDPCSQAVHDCGADVYRVRYDFRGWPDWVAEWRVSGPRKDYTMVSRFRRDGGGPAG